MGPRIFFLDRVSYSRLFGHCSLFVLCRCVGCLMFFVCKLLSRVRCALFVVRLSCLLLVVCRLVVVAYCLIRVVCKLLMCACV